MVKTRKQTKVVVDVNLLQPKGQTSKRQVNKKGGKLGLTKSAEMITLWLDKVPIKVIYRQMGVRYNFVNNVIHRYCRKHKLVFTTYNDVTESKKSVIQRLYFDDKLTMKEIAHKCNTHPTYVWNCVDEKRQSMK